MAVHSEQKKGSAGSVLILLGLLCLVGAAGFIAYNYWDAARAEKASNAILEQLEQLMPETHPASGSGETSGGKNDIGSSANLAENQAPRQVSYRDMHTMEIDGYLYIGILEIPSLSLSLPVMQKWDYDRLKISPCRYSGSYYTDDLVICAHNYARHFSPIKGISMGADVWFVTVDGDRIHYITDNIQTIQPVNIEEMVKNEKNSITSNNNWDMTLFTCNTGGTTRCAVRCVRVSDK